MIFAALDYPERYEDIHDGLFAFINQHFGRVEEGLQGDSWIWIWVGDDKVAVDTFTSLKHQVKSSRPGKHVEAVLHALKQQYTVHVYPKPEMEPHEPEKYEEGA
jgi:hypothetical protein